MHIKPHPTQRRKYYRDAGFGEPGPDDSLWFLVPSLKDLEPFNPPFALAPATIQAYQEVQNTRLIRSPNRFPLLPEMARWDACCSYLGTTNNWDFSIIEIQRPEDWPALIAMPRDPSPGSCPRGYRRPLPREKPQPCTHMAWDGYQWTKVHDSLPSASHIRVPRALKPIHSLYPLLGPWELFDPDNDLRPPNVTRFRQWRDTGGVFACYTYRHQSWNRTLAYQ